MRAPALLLPLLAVILACKPDSGDDTGGSSSGDVCSDDVLGDANPDYPPCTCDYKCEGDSMCIFSPDSSICLPSCTPGPSCENPNLPCKDSDCPTLSGITLSCDGGRCLLGCSNADPCPDGYVCGGNNICEVQR